MFRRGVQLGEKEIYTSLPLQHVVETVELSKRLISDEEYAIAKKGLEELEKERFVTEGLPKERLYHNSILVAKRNRYRRIIKRYQEQKEQPKLPMELHVVRIGDVAFASNRFELYMDYMHRIQARSPFMQTFVIQLAGQPGSDGGTYFALLAVKRDAVIAQACMQPSQSQRWAGTCR